MFDIRSELFSSRFPQGLEFDSYVASGSAGEQRRWNDSRARVELTEAQRLFLGSWTRVMHVVVLSGIWCGDCARQCPIIAAIAAACPVMKLRFFDNEQYPELRDELRIHGAARVPVVITLSEDFFEVSRFGDRPLSTYRRKAATELGPACDAGLVPPTGDEVSEDLAEWMTYFERAQLLLRLSPFLRRRHDD